MKTPHYYGEPPVNIGQIVVPQCEMMFYQYLPIKMAGSHEIRMERRLDPFKELVGKVACDFIGEFGLDSFVENYLYLTAKYAYQGRGNYFNRTGYHCDGFLTDDINYIWSDAGATIFNAGEFDLTQDDQVSMAEMNEQAVKENEITYPDGSVLRLNQYNVHCVDETFEGMRCFVKLSFSKDKYNLAGNAHNYEFDYQWEMKQRQIARNIPQK